jgi:hypothetical protein
MNGQVSDTRSPARAQSRLRLLLLDLARRWPGRAPGGRASPPAGPSGPEHHPRSGRSAGRRYKYRALVTLVPRSDDDPEATLPSPVCRFVVRARHPETHRSKLFSALVTSDDDLQPGRAHMVTVVVLGGDANDYLAPGEHFALLRGRDVARGTVTSRVFV